MTDYAERLFSEEPTNPKPSDKKDYANKLFGGPIAYNPEATMSAAFDPESKITTPFAGQLKGSFVNDPYLRAKIFAQERGIPVSKYRVTPQGDIEYKTDEGQWKKEDVSAVASIIAHPSTYLGTAGAATFGVPGAVGGAALGEVVRKGVGTALYGEKRSYTDLLDIGLEGIFGLAGEGAGKLIGGAVNRFIGKKTRILERAGQEIKERLLTPQDHAKALWVQQLAQQHGMELAPHQLYDKEGMTNIWKYLRKHPLTSDTIRAFEDNLEKSGDDAIHKFIRDMGGFEKTPYGVGKQVKEMAEQAHGRMDWMRKEVTSPLYKKAFSEVSDKHIVVSGVIKEIDNVMSKTVSADPAYGVLKRVRDMIEEAGNDAAKLDRVKRYGIDNILASEKATPDLRRQLGQVKEMLTSTLEHQVPGYGKAKAAYAKLSGPIKRFEESILGEISEAKSEAEIMNITKKLFSLRNVDESLMKRARQTIQFEDPELWNKAVGSHIRDVYEGLRVTEEGKVANMLGKLQKQLFGSPKQRRLMKAAMEPQQYEKFSDLMTIFQRASVGMGKESMTAPFQEIEKQMGKIGGSKIYRFAMFPKQATVEWTFGKWNDILLSGRQKELTEALVSPDITRRITELKQLPPYGRKFIESFGVLTALVSERILESKQ